MRGGQEQTGELGGGDRVDGRRPTKGSGGTGGGDGEGDSKMNGGKGRIGMPRARLTRRVAGTTKGHGQAPSKPVGLGSVEAHGEGGAAEAAEWGQTTRQ